MSIYFEIITAYSSCVVFLIKILAWLFLKTKAGYLLSRARPGTNENMRA